MPAVRSTAPLSQPSETSTGAEVTDAYAAGMPDVEVEDEDPSDVLRRVQAGMSAARLSVPLHEQIEVVGEQFYPKEIRKLFRECGMPITAAGCTLESEMCFLVPEPWNPHDPNAVAVMVRTFHVGHLPAALARRYHGHLIPYAQRRQRRERAHLEPNRIRRHGARTGHGRCSRGCRPLSSDLAGLKDVDGFGQLPGLPRAAAEFAQDAPGLELGVGALAGGA